MAGHGGSPPFDQEQKLNPQAPGSVPKPESLEAEQYLVDVDELVTVFRQLGLQDQEDQEEIDEAAFSKLVGQIRDYIPKGVSERNIEAMKRHFSSWPPRTEVRRGQEPETLMQLFEAVAQRHRHMQVVYLQGLLYEAGRQDLCKDVQAMVEETPAVAAGTMRIPYIIFGPPRSSYRNLASYVGVFQVYMESTFEDIDLKLQKLIRELSRLLGLRRRLVKVKSITTENTFWITVLVPLPAMELLRQKFYQSSIDKYLASIGITKIKFLQPPKTDEGKKGKGKKRERTPEPTKGKTEPIPGTSMETKPKKPKREPEAEIRTEGEEKPQWMSWEKEDILRCFSNEGHEKLGEKLKEKTTSGRGMVKWNPDFLMKIGLQETELDIVKAVMEKQNMFKASIITKVMNDPVHKHMEFHPLCVKIIDTPEFQRLRNIKQLGSVYLVYPGAAHNRFEHSLGVGHLAQKLVRSLQQRQPELGITEEDVLCVSIAGLCHDLGHGPHSHLFEYFMKNARPDRDWQHEDASVMMFNHLVEKNNIRAAFRWYGMDDEKYLDFIRAQIKGKKITKEDIAKVGEKQFLLEIVANRRNGIDVDKWDLIARDCLMLGIPNSFDHLRFMKHARVIKYGEEWQICSRDKEAEDLYKMFQTVHFLNRRAYQHKTHQAIEVMLVDALTFADKSGEIRYRGQKRRKLSISECVDDPVAFTNLDDSVFSLIQLSSSEKESMTKAKEILDRIYSRRFYKLVGESDPTDEEDYRDHLEKLTAAPMSPDKVAVKEMKLDYGTAKKNPVLQTHFYEKGDPFTAITISRKQVSLILPEHFSEYIVRLYCKVEDEDTISEARKHFQDWLRPRGLTTRASVTSQ